ncbi:hypothetical protein CKM354_001015700 [Cercospora kikuchii]|uniref:Apple domain-containing protein n=1 Tax=Cercospora kikuchii TaxID=84275 RepID=A0A9P3FH09_9PEZI|nr:uncharacterized protein CKM354_001015700 [Cercospora kikuchii]GIZ47056.1 hypothetical protein CKM354_001015700 [Cercospora kikuchii]
MSLGLVSLRPGQSIARDLFWSLLLTARFAQAQLPQASLVAGGGAAGTGIPPCLNAVTVTVFPPDYTGIFASLTIPGIPLTTLPPLTLPTGLPDLGLSSLISEIGEVLPTNLPGGLSSLLSDIGGVVPTNAAGLESLISNIGDALPTPTLPLDVSSLLSGIVNPTDLVPDLSQLVPIPSITLPPLVSGVLDIVSAVLPTSQLPRETPVSFACPRDNGKVIIENGLPYVLNCNGAATGNVFGTRVASNSFNNCFLECDQASVTGLANFCTAFYYVGTPNGDGPGTCYLQNSVAQSFQVARGYISAARLLNYIVGGLSPIPLLDSASSIIVSIPAGLTIPTGLPTIPIPSLPLSLPPLPSDILQLTTALPPLTNLVPGLESLLPTGLPLSDLTNVVPELTSLLGEVVPTGLPLSELTNLVPGLTSLLGEVVPTGLPLSDLTNLVPGLTSLLNPDLPLPTELPLSDLTNLIPGLTTLLPTGLPLPTELPLSELTNLVPGLTTLLPTDLPLPTALPISDLTNLIPGLTTLLPTNLPLPSELPLSDLTNLVPGLTSLLGEVLPTALPITTALAPIPEALSSIIGGLGCNVNSLLTGLGLSGNDSIVSAILAGPTGSICSQLSNLPTARPTLPLSTPSISVPSGLPLTTGLPSLSVPSLSVPSSGLPSLSVPSLGAPSISAPTLSVPSLSAPSLSISSLSAPSLSVPSISAPSLSTPGNPLTNLPGLASSRSSAAAASTSTIPELSLPTSTRRPVFNCPADNGLSYVAPSGQAFTIRCRTNYIGYDLASSPQPNLFSCANSCAFVPGCSGVTYDAQTSLCSYKSSVGSGTPSLITDGAAPVNLDCPAGNGLTYTDFSEANYQVFCNVTFPASTNVTSNINAGGAISARGESLMHRARQAAVAVPAVPGVPDIIRCSIQCSVMEECEAVTQQNNECVFISNLGNSATGSTIADSVVLVGRQINDGSGATSTSVVTGIPTQASTRQASAINNAPTTTTTAVLPPLPTLLPPANSATSQDCGLLGLNCGPTRSQSAAAPASASTGAGGAISAYPPGASPATSVSSPAASSSSTSRDCGLLGLNCIGGNQGGGNNAPASTPTAASSPSPAAASSSTSRDCGLLGLNCIGGNNPGGGNSAPTSTPAAVSDSPPAAASSSTSRDCGLLGLNCIGGNQGGGNNAPSPSTATGGAQTVTVTPLPASITTSTTRSTSYSQLTTVLPVTTVTTTSTFTYCNVGPNNFTSCTSTVVVRTPTPATSTRSSTATTSTRRDCGLLGLNCI